MKTIPIAILCGLLAATLPALAASLKVDKERSRIQVDAKATGHVFTGTLADYQATVSGNESTLEPSAAKLTWKFSDLKTGEEKRDKEMIQWLGGGAPTGSFEFIKTWKDGGKTYAQGTLKIHGVSKTIAFPYTAKREGGWVTIDGTASLDYTDFGLPIISTMAVMKVNPKLSVRFHLVGKS
jgi:polyisoprenoid-binding protein YceI